MSPADAPQYDYFSFSLKSPLSGFDYISGQEMVLFTIENGERIAQLVIAKHERAEWQEVDELSETSRGAGGFGSTGTK